ncbi:MAG TPA: DNA repair protein RecO [Steroidobacteraceae bacterium]
MSPSAAGSRRVALAPAYLLHHRPYRDTSRILEIFARDHGRLTLFARGARGPHSKLAPVLRPFCPLLVSWSGRGEAAQLTACEAAYEAQALPRAHLMAGFYLNELLLKLTTRHDPQSALFDEYHRALEGLKAGAPVEPVLRLFEKHLLETLGYGLDLIAEAVNGRAIEAAAYYHFRPTHGLACTVPESPGAFAGCSLIALAREDLSDPRTLDDARRLLRSALAQCLDGRELSTRAVARAIATRRETGR